MARKERGRCFIARITDYQAREEMTTQGTGVEIDPQTASTSGRILSDIGRGIEGASEKLLQVQKVAETTRAQNEHEKALLSVETDFAKEDLSSKTPEQLAELKSKYSTRINEARSKSADHISMPGWKRDWNAEQQHNSNITQANIDSLFLKKYVDNAKGQLEDFINIQGKKYVETRNQPERVNSVLELTTKLEEAEKSGFLTHAAGEKLKIETLKKWDEAHVLHSINNNPYQALADLKAGDKGLYAGVDTKVIDKGIQAAQKRVDFLDKKKQSDLEADMTRNEIDGNLTMAEVEASFKNKLVSRSFYESRKKTLESVEGATADTDKPTFNKLTKMLVSPDTKPTDARNAILEANAEGKISRTDMEKLYQMHLIPSNEERQSLQQIMGDQSSNDFNKVKAFEDAKTKLMEDKGKWWHSAFSMIDNTLGNDEKALASAKQELYDRMSNGNIKASDAPTEAKKVLSDKFLSSHPEVKTFPKEGKVIGGFRYFPDGTSQEESK